VFNDWGVGVPGIMLITWPDPWYHTSGDRVDKIDATQMKRVVIIGAAGAYTVASADDDMAQKIAGEVATNGTRRLGHQLAIALEILNKATAKDFSKAYKKASIQISTALTNERETLGAVLELAKDKAKVGSYVGKMQKTIDAVGAAHMAALKAHMETLSGKFGVRPVKVLWTEEEKKASKMIPRPTSKVKEKGYRVYREFITQVPKEESDKYPYGRRDIGSTSELQCLINGKRSVLDIKHMLDAQYSRESKLQSVLNYIQILKLAGLVDM
jgi:uncharacterized protein YjgD (DUF1641 family)